MPALLIRYRVSNYPAWKRVFDDQAFARKANGCQAVQIFHNADVPQEMVVVLTWDTLMRARLFAQSEDLQTTIDRADPIDCLDIWLLDEPTNELCS